MAKPSPDSTPLDQARFYNIPNMKRHLLLCIGPDCCTTAQGELSWNYLKKRIAELKLDLAPTNVFRTRCGCLRVCTHGPILCIQPDNTWYHSATPEIIEKVLQNHILHNQIVTENAFVDASLCSPSPASPESP